MAQIINIKSCAISSPSNSKKVLNVVVVFKIFELGLVLRLKHTLPDLPYDYNALEPVISADIMKVSMGLLYNILIYTVSMYTTVREMPFYTKMSNTVPKVAEKPCPEPATQMIFYKELFLGLFLIISLCFLFVGAPRQTPRHVCEETKRGRGQDGGSNVQK
jgi:hypothetical protein